MEFTNNQQGKLPSDLKFTVNNSPSAQPAFVGQKLIGQTLTIDESTIVDFDNAGSQATNHLYQWLISDDGIYGRQFLISVRRKHYDLTEADANKYFKSIVQYTDGLGTAEVAESDPFRFTENVEIVDLEDFEDGSANGWTYVSSNSNPSAVGTDVLVDNIPRLAIFWDGLHISRQSTYSNHSGGGEFALTSLQ